MHRAQFPRIPTLLGGVVVALGVTACGFPTAADFEDLELCSRPAPAVTRVVVQPTQVINLRIGYDFLIQATPVDARGDLIFCAPNVQWASANPAVATVSNGRVAGVSVGKTYIRASSGGAADSAAVNVVATTIESVTIESVPTSLLVGQTALLKLMARDTDGNVITPTSIQWRTEDPAIATISSSGMLVAQGTGAATVSAVAEGRTAEAKIPVTRDAPTRRFRQVAAGFQHTCAIVGGGGIPEGTAFCWGDGTVGQLGIGAIVYAAVPLRVTGGHTFASIAVGDNSSCGTTVSGETYCWGKNDSGQLGDGTTVDRIAPVRVASTVPFRSLALGGSMSCGLTDEGAAYCWGSTYTWAGQTPTAPHGDLLFSQISAGVYHVCGVAIADGLGYCWGRMDARPLGPAITQGTRETPVLVPGDLRLTSISAGSNSTCGVTTLGSYCVGATSLSNSDGGSSPTPIPGEDRHRFAVITSGFYHACAIDTNGGGWCWGRNYEGQIGAGEIRSAATEPLQLRIR